MKELINIKIYILLRNDNDSKLTNLISKTDVVIHLAGENRPKELKEFKKVNVDLTDKICNSIRKEFTKTNRKIKFILASSTQAEQNNEYGISKLLAEQSVQSLSNDLDIPVTIFRFPGVFGKWCKPNYNSVVANFCDNIVKNLPIKIRDPDFVISLVYIDDVINKILEVILSKHKGINKASVKPEYTRFGYKEIEGFPMGIGVVSKYPIIYRQVVHIDSPKSGYAHLKLLVDEKILNVVAVHPPSPRTQALWHRRNKVLAQVSLLLNDLKEPWLVVGDLNIVPWSNYIAINQGKWCYTALGHYYSWTATEKGPSALMGLPIDHCVTSPDINIHTLQVTPFVGSDHLLLDHSLSF